jgi:hypothetical protein
VAEVAADLVRAPCLDRGGAGDVDGGHAGAVCLVGAGSRRCGSHNWELSQNRRQIHSRGEVGLAGGLPPTRIG